MQKTTWKIGELAGETGITVRTLHHYHEIVLLIPSKFTESGHRLYTKPDIERLQHILSLKQMGFPLEEIKDFIEKPGFNPILVIQTQLENINGQIKLKEQLRNELEQLLKFLLYKQDISPDQLFKIMEVIRMNEKNYMSPEQVEKLKNINDSLTDEQKIKMQEQFTLR